MHPIKYTPSWIFLFEMNAIVREKVLKSTYVSRLLDVSFPVTSSPKPTFAMRVTLFYQPFWSSGKTCWRQTSICPRKLPYRNFTFIP